MEKINLHNYEAFFLDSVEGNLNEFQLIELNKFLTKHPELNSELEEFELITFSEDIVENTALKNTLLKEESTAINKVEYLMIAQAEGVITVEEKKELSEIIKADESLLTDLAIYHKTILPKETVQFSGKSALLQKVKKGFIWWPYLAAASVLALVFFNLNTIERTYNPRNISWQEAVIESDELEYAGIEIKEDNKVLFKAEKIVKQNNRPLRTSNSSLAQTKKVGKLEELKAENQLAEVKTTLKIGDGDIGKKVDESFIDNVQVAQLKTELKKIPLDKVNQDPTDQKNQIQLKNSNQDEFVPLRKFAKDKYKKDILKGKTFTETIMDEVADATNEKVTFKSTKNKEGKTERFALNIGKFSFSRNK